MFDVAPTELLLVAVVAVVVIGPKDLPKAMRIVGYWVGRARGVARQFRSGFDEMVREAEFAEMEKKWQSENERIMREFPTVDGPVAAPAALPAPDAAPAADAAADEPAPAMTVQPTLFDEAQTVEHPVVEAADAPAPPPAADGKAPS